MTVSLAAVFFALLLASACNAEVSVGFVREEGVGDRLELVRYR